MRGIAGRENAKIAELARRGHGARSKCRVRSAQLVSPGRHGDTKGQERRSESGFPVMPENLVNGRMEEKWRGLADRSVPQPGAPGGEAPDA